MSSSSSHLVSELHFSPVKASMKSSPNCAKKVSKLSKLSEPSLQRSSSLPSTSKTPQTKELNVLQENVKKRKETQEIVNMNHKSGGASSVCENETSLTKRRSLPLEHSSQGSSGNYNITLSSHNFK